MHAASRDALKAVAEYLDTLVSGDNAVTLAAQTGIELFEVVSLLDQDRSLRVAIADSSVAPEQRVGLVDTLFTAKLSSSTVAVLKRAAQQEWSTTRELRSGLIITARRGLLRGAEKQGQLKHVEQELFALSRLLDREPELTQLLTDRRAESSAKRGLLADILYGKVSMFTEALALQVIGRPENNPIDDIAAVVEQAADLRNEKVAHVVSAEELNDSQRASLAVKLGRIYGREMAVHTEVDPSLLGGMIVRVGDEVIDGSTRGKLTRMRVALT